MKRIITATVAGAALFLMAAELDECGSSVIDQQLGQTTFTDLPADHDFYAGARVAEAEGWFVGNTDGTLRPDQTITAQQIASVVERVFADGATRGEVATFLAEGTIALRQHAIDIELIQARNEVVIINRSSQRFVMDGWTLDANYTEVREFTDTAILAPYKTLTLPIASADGSPVTSASLDDQYGLTIATDS